MFIINIICYASIIVMLILAMILYILYDYGITFNEEGKAIYVREDLFVPLGG